MTLKLHDKTDASLEEEISPPEESEDMKEQPNNPNREYQQPSAPEHMNTYNRSSQKGVQTRKGNGKAVTELDTVGVMDDLAYERTDALMLDQGSRDLLEELRDMKEVLPLDIRSSYQYQSGQQMITRAISMVNSNQSERKREPIVFDDINQSVFEVTRGIETIIAEYQKHEGMEGLGPIKRAYFRFAGRAPKIPEEQLAEHMEETLSKTESVFDSLLVENEREHQGLFKEYRTLGNRVSQSIKELCSLQKDIENGTGYLERINAALEGYKGKEVDFSRPEETQQFHELSENRMYYERNTCKNIDKYLTKLKQLKTDKDSATYVMNWMQMNNMLQLTLRGVVEETKSIVEDVRRQRELFGPIAISSEIVGNIYSVASKMKDFGEKRFKKDLRSFSGLKDTYKTIINNNQQSFEKRETKMLSILDDIKSARMETLQTYTQNQEIYH